MLKTNVATFHSNSFVLSNSIFLNIRAIKGNFKDSFNIFLLLCFLPDFYNFVKFQRTGDWKILK